MLLHSCKGRFYGKTARYERFWPQKTSILLRKGAFDRPIFPRSKGSHSGIGPIPIYGVLAHSMITRHSYMYIMYCTTIIIFIALTVGVIGHCPDDEESQETQPKSLFYKNASVLASVECPIARDCKEWYEVGINKSGIYPIKPDDKPSFQVYCDMETEGGGWTVFQRRQDGSVDFYRNWTDYEDGFGTLSSEHWLGLSKLHRLASNNSSNSLRVDLKDFSSNTAYAQYNSFQISGPNSQYTISVSGYRGTAGNSLRTHHNKMKFSTKDRDNDTSNISCAVVYKGAWWYGACHWSNLNGQYKPTRTTTYGNGVQWTNWRGPYYSLKFSEMKVRRN